MDLAMATDIINVLTSYCTKRGGRKPAAEALGITYRHLCFMLTGDREVSGSIASKLGYRKSTVYVRMVR